MNTNRYSDVLKRKQELEAALAATAEELETLEASEEKRVTVENVETGVLLGVLTANNERTEVFLTSEQVGELVFELVANANDLSAVTSPFRREFDTFFQLFV